MASLLSFAGNLANRLGNTINHDVYQPVVRDVAQPIQRSFSAPLQGPSFTPVNSRAPVQIGPVRVAPPIYNAGPATPHASILHDLTHNAITKGLGDQAKGLIHIPHDIANSPVGDVAKLGAASVTSNQQAHINAMNQLHNNFKQSPAASQPVATRVNGKFVLNKQKLAAVQSLSMGAMGAEGAPKLTAAGAKQLATKLTTPPKEIKATAPVVGTKGTGLVKTVGKSPQTTPSLKTALEPLQGKRVPLANKTSLAAADKRIAADPNEAHQFALDNHSAEGNAVAIKLAKQYEAAGKHDQAANLIVTKSQQALKAGQGNQIYSVWDKLSPETVARTAQKTIEKYNQGAKSPIPSLTGEQYKAFGDQSKNIQKLPENSRARGMATQKLLKQIGQLVPSKTGDKIFSLYRTGLLTGFRTPGKVLVSHALSSGFEQVKNVPAVIADKGISLATGKRGLSFTARGNAAGAKSGTFAAVDNLIHGYDAPGSGGIAHDFANSTHFNTNTLHGKIAQGYVDTIGHLHGSLYKPFYGAQHLNSLYDMAITNAKNAGIKGAQRDSFVQDFVKKATDASVKDQTANAHADFTTPEGAAQRANAEAAYTTFQNKTLLSEAAAGFKSKTPGAKYVIPFSQIPSSIASKVVDYSPVGVIKEAIIQAKNGSFDQRALSQAIGRSATGTGIAALGYHLYNSGNITTAYPTDKKEQAQWKLNGTQANSIKVGGKWRQLSSLGPAGDTLAVGASVAEGMKGNKKTPGSVGNAALGGLIGGEQVVAQSPYLQGAQNAMTAITQPTKGQKLAESLAGGIIPTGVANIATATDPLQRQTNSPVDSVTNKIPGLREKNLPQVDVLGRNIPRAQGALGTLLDPFYSTTAKTDPVTSELNRLNNTYNPATPTPLSKNQSIAGQKVNLNPKQLTQLQQESGGVLNQQLQSLIQSPSYQAASDQTKANTINSAITQVRDQVKNSVALNGGKIQGSGTGGAINLGTVSQSNQLKLDKASFDGSGKNFSTINGIVYQKNIDDTDKTPVLKSTYDYNVGKTTLTAQKNNGDVNGWISTAQGQLKLIQDQLNNPNVNSDPLQVATLQNDAQSLQNDIAKYTSYGGFTKGKSGGSGSSARAKIPNFKTTGSSLKAPKVGRISIKGGSKSAPKFRVPKSTSTKAAGLRVPKLTNKTPKVARAKVNVPKKVA